MYNIISFTNNLLILNILHLRKKMQKFLIYNVYLILVYFAWKKEHKYLIYNKNLFEYIPLKTKNA